MMMISGRTTEEEEPAEEIDGDERLSGNLAPAPDPR